MNFTFYVSVAVFGNLTGFLMNLFPPVRRDGILVYCEKSYLAVFLVLAVVSIPVLIGAFRMRETFGKYTPDPNG